MEEQVRSFEELEEVLDSTRIALTLEESARLMKVLELAENALRGTEQGELAQEWAELLYNEINEHITDEEFIRIEENNLLKEL